MASTLQQTSGAEGRPEHKASPRMQHSNPRRNGDSLRYPRRPQRTVFNCIVDETALLAGGSVTTRDGFRKWVKDGSVNLFIPLYACEQLQKISRSTIRNSSDAGEILQWLNEATDDVSNARVNLQGPLDQYASWSEVEKYLLPETILKHDRGLDEVDDLTGDFHDKAAVSEGSDKVSLSSSGTLENRSKSPSSPRSPHSISSPKSDRPNTQRLLTPAHSRNASQRSIDEMPRTTPAAFSTKVPPSLQPLLNFVIWRVNHDHNPSAAFASFILLSNDAVTQSCASKFGIRVKRVEQLRETIKREEREYKNRLIIYNKEVTDLKTKTTLKDCESKKDGTVDNSEIVLGEQSAANGDVQKPEQTDSPEDDSDVDEVILKRPIRGSPIITASEASKIGTNGAVTGAIQPPMPEAQISSLKVLDPNDFGRSPAGSMRGKPQPPRGPRNFSPRAAVKQPTRGLGQPIDPDLYFRPPPSRNSARGGRRLWEPT